MKQIVHRLCCCLMLAGMASGAVPAQAASEFAAARPAVRVEYWQKREATIAALLQDSHRLAATKLLFLGDSITDFWGLGDNPWQGNGRRFGLAIWNESFAGKPPENLALNFGISGDRTEHVLHRLLPRSAGSVYAGIKAVLDAAHARKPRSQVILQSLLPTNEAARNRDVVVPVNQRLALLAASGPYAGYVHYLDLVPAFVDAEGRQIEKYFDDGLHPNETGYRVWRDQLLPFLGQVRAHVQ